MRSTRQPLEYEDGLVWIRGVFERKDGQLWIDRMVVDTGTAHTILSTELAEFLGYPKSAKEGIATFDSPDGPVDGYTVHIPGLTVLGHEVRSYLVGCKPLYSSLNVAAILGVDFFKGTDLLLSFTKMSIHLAF